MDEVAALERKHAREVIASLAQKLIDRRVLFVVVLIGAAVVYTQAGVRTQITKGDLANWEYMAQVISRGGVPYRDVVNIKTPLSAYIGAVAIVVGRPLGLRDLFAMRLMYSLLGILTVGFTYVVTVEYFGSRRMGVLAAVILAGVDSYTASNTAGIQPKTPMILFGLLTLWAIRKDWPVTAGVCGMLAALSWQPGLLFFGAAGLAFSRYLTSWRDLKVVRLIAGAMAPLAITLIYFWWVGALRDFYLWTIDFNLHVYGPREMRSFSHFFDYLARMARGQYRSDRRYLYLSVVGILFVIWEELKAGRKGGVRQFLEAAPRHAIIIAPLVYFAFCMIDVQGGADLFPFLPFIAIFTAVAIVSAVDRGVELAWHVRPWRYRTALERVAFAMVLVLVMNQSLKDEFSRHKKPGRLKEQETEVAQITSNLQEGDKIFAHGATEVLVLSGLSNVSKYFFLDRGKDGYLSKVEPGGFEGWFARLKAERPKVVLLGRMRQVDCKKDLDAWVDADYELRKLRMFIYYVRKD